MKFPFKKKAGVVIWDAFNDLDFELLKKFMGNIPDGKRMEMIIRAEIVWNADQMKKYFEGPVVDFVQKCYNQEGKVIAPSSIRDGLKGMFIGWTEPNEFGQVFPLSRKELDTPKDGVSPRNRWKQFLRNIDSYCMDRFGHGLPTHDNTDIGD